MNPSFTLEPWMFRVAVLRAMTQAYYAPANRGHFGLSLGSYAHFTSPIRRYADHLVVMRAGAILAAGPPREIVTGVAALADLLGGGIQLAPLNTAVANSALTIATRMGMDVTLLCPTADYILDERYMGWARDNVAESGGSLTVSHDIDSAYDGADIVYAKSWGALPYFGHWHDEQPIRDRFKHFIVDERKMALTNDGVFSHCLPLRRNVKATDAVMDSPNCIAINEAENRLHVQKAVMAALAAQPGFGIRD